MSANEGDGPFEGEHGGHVHVAVGVLEVQEGRVDRAHPVHGLDGHYVSMRIV